MPFTVMRNGGEGAACQLRDNGTTILMHYSRPPPSNLKMSEELAHNSFPPFPTCAWRSLVGCISPRRVQHMNQSGSEGPRSSPYFRRRRTITEAQKQDECRKICVGSDANAIAICLQQVKVRGQIPCCNHVFCFTCITEWSKVTNTCPLCKQVFHEIRRCSVS